MGGRKKYQRIEALYTEGVEVALGEDAVAWMQVLNPWERQEARKAAQTARARMVLAMKQEGTDEMAQAEAAFLVSGVDEAVRRLADMHDGEAMVKVLDAIRDDPDWAERMEIFDRAEDLSDREPDDPEARLLERINLEYVREVTERLKGEREQLESELRQMSEEDLVAAYRDRYIEQLGNQVATDEYQLSELWLSARCCDATLTETGWDHSSCEGHRQRIYDEKGEVRCLPAGLLEKYQQGLDALAMTERDAKNSDRQRSSSASSPLPSEEGESTASTPSETPDAAPGPLLSPSTMP